MGPGDAADTSQAPRSLPAEAGTGRARGSPAHAAPGRACPVNPGSPAVLARSEPTVTQPHLTCRSPASRPFRWTHQTPLSSHLELNAISSCQEPTPRGEDWGQGQSGRAALGRGMHKAPESPPCSSLPGSGRCQSAQSSHRSQSEVATQRPQQGSDRLPTATSDCSPDAPWTTQPLKHHLLRGSPGEEACRPECPESSPHRPARQSQLAARAQHQRAFLTRPLCCASSDPGEKATE